MEQPGGVRLTRRLIIFVVAPVALLLGAYTLIVSHPAGADPEKNTPTGFGLSITWANGLCVGNETCATADVNGDGRADAVAFVKSTHGEPDRGDVLVGLSTGKAFGKPARWADSFCLDSTQVCVLADMDGDGRADAVTFVRGARPEPDRGDVFVALSTGKGFGKAARWSDKFCVDSETCLLADVNGDGRADAVAIPKTGPGGIDVALSTGKALGPAGRWAGNLCTASQSCAIADVTGDHKADVVIFTKSQRGDVQVATSNGKHFTNPARWFDSFCTGSETCAAADVTGDGKADAVSFVKFTRDEPERGDVITAISAGSMFKQAARWSDSLCTHSETCQLADVDGDRRADTVLFAGNGTVTVALATGPARTGTSPSSSSKPGAKPSAKPSASPSASAGLIAGVGSKGSLHQFHPSTEAPPCACVTPTPGMTAIANAMRFRSASVSTVMTVPAGLPVTAPTEISILFERTRITQVYDRVSGNRIKYDFAVKDGNPRNEHVDIALVEHGAAGISTFLFQVFVPVEALYQVDISPLTFQLLNNCDDFTESEPEVAWRDDRGYHYIELSLSAYDTARIDDFARSQLDARVSYGMQRAQFGFVEIDTFTAAFVAVGPAGPLLPGGSYTYQEALVAHNDHQCNGTVSYTATINLNTFDQL